MSWREVARTALRDVRRRPLRNGLATLGIVLGTATLVALLSLSAGLQRALVDRAGERPLFTAIQVTAGSSRAGEPARVLDGPAVDALGRAITANDPAALYPLLNAQASAAYGPAAFVTAWNSQSPTLGRVTALRRTATGSAQATASGFWFVSSDYSADIVTPAGVGSAVFTAFFIHEPTGWKLWTTVRR